MRTGTSYGDIFQGVTGDTLIGGLGDDTYHLWAISAAATESSGQGNDTVYAYYWGGATLSANIENLILNGKGMTAGTGNALNNIIVAGGVAATLNGLGGDDVLVGGVGADIFVVTAGNGSDAIYSFTPGFDIVRLNGYNISNFDQIVSHSQQIGSDLKLAFGNGESLVLRNVALSDLDPTDFGFALPKAPVPLGYTQMYGADRGYNAHGWYVLTNAWGAGSLKFGTDYSVDAIYNKTDMTKGTIFNWDFPYVTQVAAPIKAYPNVLFGVSPQGEQINPTDTTRVFPARVGSLTGLTATHDVTMRGNVGGYNVSYDVWFTTKPNGSKPTITNELMIWVHKGDVQPFGNVIGTYVDGAFTATIYRTGTYTAVVADKDMLAGTIDIGKVIAHLQSLGIISAEEYLACINFGAEVIGGHGSITLNDLDLRVGTMGANGIVETLVTGSGSSAALAPTAPAATPVPAPVAAPDKAPADAVSAPAASVPAATAGHDQLYGTSGADTLKGGTGNDIYHADAKDTIVELAGEGIDEVRTAASTFTLSANVENLTGTGSAGQALIGNALANVITGGAGNDTLNGAGGIDTLQGGLGNDVYFADGDDAVTEAVGAGVDEVRTAAASFTLNPNIEYLTGTASTGQVLTGNGMQNIIIAGAGADTLYGGGGKDNLDGGAGNDVLDGGALADTLKGGLGDDIYLTDGLDSIIEAANAGIDEVRTSVSSFTLVDNLENLTGTGSVGQTLIGNALANLITGGVSNDTLDGGAGNDILDGG
ncbi:GH12 family glycosyl hydrolase domain-containing protein, partial [Allosphingosinicella deserti]|uniref:GH12 family glycosyl hydrolase domain-containing protein n=1 Tax=Allosphingosinicella deserti TaxID=2116704 RepID=UPI0038CD6595